MILYIDSKASGIPEMSTKQITEYSYHIIFLYTLPTEYIVTITYHLPNEKYCYFHKKDQCFCSFLNYHTWILKNVLVNNICMFQFFSVQTSA